MWARNFGLRRAADDALTCVLDYRRSFVWPQGKTEHDASLSCDAPVIGDLSLCQALHDVLVP